MNDDKIIERVRRLLSMAEDASSPNEAMIAARRARSLMDKHQISKADIESAVGTQFLETEAKKETSVRRQWMRFLSHSAAILNDCDPLLSSSPRVRYFFQGFKSDAIVAKLTMDYFVDTCERLCSKSTAVGVSNKNFYRVGFSQSIALRAEEIVKERDKLKTSNGKGLVFCKKSAIAKHFGDYPTVKQKPVREPSPDEMISYLAGREDGQNVGLEKQINREHKPRISAHKEG